MTIYYFTQIVLLSLLGLATLYIFIFSVAGLFYKQQIFSTPEKLPKIAVLIPGYREDEVIVEAAKSALQQKYPLSLFDVVIIADSLKNGTLDALKQHPIKLIEVSFDKSTKAKALNAAMSLLPGNYDIAVVLDADNIMEPGFLVKVSAPLSQKYLAVQGHRTAKNTNNSWAVMDAVSEEINNHIFRKGHRVLGLSSAIIGSGMAFNYSYFKSLMATVTAVGGFDKEIELKMLKQKNKIVYLHNARVYDEKVQHPAVFENQRKRWLSAQFHYFRKDILTAIYHLLAKGNVDYFDKAIQFIQPPRILLLGAVCIFGSGFLIANLLLDTSWLLSAAWFIVTVACILSFLFSIPRKFYTGSTLKALVSLPRGMFTMVLSLFKIKGANKQFIHTKHTATSHLQ